METKKAFSEARVYVGTYAKYAGGSIEGAWLNISDYDSLEDFLKACRELHKERGSARVYVSRLGAYPL